MIGSALVFASAVSYAFYLLRAGPLLVRLGPARVAAWGTTIACLLALAQFVVLRPLATIVAQPWQVQVLERGDGGVLHGAAGLVRDRGDAPARARDRRR